MAATKRANAAGRAPAATLVYDRSCGSCSWFARRVRALDSRGDITLVALDDDGVRRRLGPRVGAAIDSSFHLIDERSGAVRSGEGALLELARLLPCVRPFAEVLYAVPGARRVPGLLYRTASAWRRCVVRAPPPPTGKAT